MPKKTKKKKQKIRKIKLSSFLIGLAAIAVFAYFLYQFLTFHILATAPTPTPEKLLNGLSQKLGTDAKAETSSYMDWISQDDKLLPLSGKQIILGTYNMKNVEKYKNLNTENLDKINFDTLSDLKSAAEIYLEGYGFKKNVPNTRITGEKPSMTDRTGLEKGNTKCIIALTEHSDPYATIFCGVIDKSQYALQQPFLSTFNIKYVPNKFMTIRVQKVEGDFATGNVSDDYMGYVWIAQKVNGIWKEIWKGGEPPLCTTVEQLKIPKSIYQSCITL